MGTVLAKLKAGQPLTAQETAAVVARTELAAARYGVWLKNCGRCGRNIGGRLASHGKPTPAELQHCGCPGCGAVGDVVLDYVPPAAEAPGC